MTIKLENLEIFVAIVEAGSISRAADNLASPKSRISRHLKDLEESLGARLLERTTRSLQLTESGERVYRDAQRILENVEALQSGIDRDNTFIDCLFLNNSEKFGELLGGAFDFHPKQQEVVATAVDPDHPLVRAFEGKPFVHVDEPYLFKGEYDKKNFCRRKRNTNSWCIFT